MHTQSFWMCQLFFPGKDRGLVHSVSCHFHNILFFVTMPEVHEQFREFLKLVLTSEMKENTYKSSED